MIHPDVLSSMDMIRESARAIANSRETWKEMCGLGRPLIPAVLAASLLKGKALAQHLAGLP